jgi:cysteine desulfurase/selenocysteine lyase
MTTSPLNPALFSLDRDHLWVMHCSEGPIPRASLRAVRSFLYKELEPWDLKWKDDFIGLPEATRREAAKLLGAKAEDISLTPTTSSGLQAVSLGFPWEAGDEVVAPLGEFPSNAWPWIALKPRGVSFREVPLWEGHRAGAEAWATVPPPPAVDPEARLLEALGPKTKVLTVSWVRFQDGLKLDLARLAAGCARKGVALVVDGIQGCGTHPVHLEGVAAFATGGHKGLLSPQGLGMLWTDPEFRARLIPTGTWLSVEQGTDFSRPSTDFDRAFVEDGRRLEAGSPPLLMAAAFRDSLHLLNSVGIPAITSHVTKLQRKTLEGLAGSLYAEEAQRLWALLDQDRLGPILAFHHRGLGSERLQALVQRGMRHGIYASVREGYLRIAYHGWHTTADVARVLEWMTAPI